MRTLPQVFLLVDVGASVRDTDGEAFEHGYGFLAMYVLAPEKFVAMAAYDEGGLGSSSFVAHATSAGGGSEPSRAAARKRRKSGGSGGPSVT